MRRPGRGRGEAGADSADGLVESAADAFEEGRLEEALERAEAALRVSPRHVAALHYRAAALAELDRLDEARDAYEAAVRAGKDDPELLLGAADFLLNVVGRDGDAEREDHERALELAARGRKLARKARDAELAGELSWLEGVALNQLGRSQEALAALTAAGEALPDAVEVLVERGFALYELCRFDDAQRAFERALSLAPDDAWTIHELGLLAERRGDRAKAEALLARARKLAPEDFPADLPVDEETFRGEVRSAIAALPERERRALDGVPVEIEDLPDAEDLLAVEPPLSPSILGLFRGPSEDEPCTAADGPRCRAIVFYRKNLVRFAHDRRELEQQVRVTLLHELGHLHGENDDELRARGLE
jgi:tetratricopeptide (TPR) repeat protein